MTAPSYDQQVADLLWPVDMRACQQAGEHRVSQRHSRSQCPVERCIDHPAYEADRCPVCVECPTCGEPVGLPCADRRYALGVGGRALKHPHQARVAAAQAGAVLR